MTWIQKAASWLLYKKLHYRLEITQELPPKFVIALAPHTSNWDFIIGILYSRAEGIRSNFMMKKFWFFWPMGCLMRHLGGIPVERSRKMSLTAQLSQEARKRDTFILCITPEGTRKRVTEWKKGFYYIALKAEIPILPYALDYEKRVIRCTKTVIPNGNIDQQMAEIKSYFKDVKGKHADKFSV